MSNFIILNSGKRFYYHNIKEDSINIMDIAHSLSHVCRFGGHVDTFYSVAQHCVIVSHLVPKEHRLAALLHDASESYLSDIVSPAKRLLNDYKILEKSITRHIDRKFNINTKIDHIHIADRMALYAEAMHFFGTVDDWGIDDYYCDVAIEPMNPRDAKRLFLTRYQELTREIS